MGVGEAALGVRKRNLFMVFQIYQFICCNADQFLFLVFLFQAAAYWAYRKMTARRTYHTFQEVRDAYDADKITFKEASEACYNHGLYHGLGFTGLA